LNTGNLSEMKINNECDVKLIENSRKRLIIECRKRWSKLSTLINDIEEACERRRREGS
jgi:hypothetical protein